MQLTIGARMICMYVCMCGGLKQVHIPTELDRIAFALAAASAAQSMLVVQRTAASAGFDNSNGVLTFGGLVLSQMSIVICDNFTQLM